MPVILHSTMWKKCAAWASTLTTHQNIPSEEEEEEENEGKPENRKNLLCTEEAQLLKSLYAL